MSKGYSEWLFEAILLTIILDRSSLPHPSSLAFVRKDSVTQHYGEVSIMQSIFWLGGAARQTPCRLRECRFAATGELKMDWLKRLIRSHFYAREISRFSAFRGESVPTTTVDVKEEAAIPLDYKRAMIHMGAAMWDDVLNSLEPEFRDAVLAATTHDLSVTVDKVAIKAAIEAGIDVPGAKLITDKTTACSVTLSGPCIRPR
jgi:hypothetical protein